MREERVQRIMIGLARSTSDAHRPDAPDWEILATYGDAPRPLAEALHDVIADIVREYVEEET